MKNVIKAALVATTALVAANTATAGSINDVKTQMEKFGVDTSDIDFSGLAEHIDVNGKYSDSLIARDAWEEDKTDFDALDDYLDALDAWESAGGDTTSKGVGWDGALELMLESAIDTEVGELEDGISDFNDNYSDASSTAVGIYVDGILNNSAHQKNVGKLGLNMVYATLGKDIKYTVGSLSESSYTDNIKADKDDGVVDRTNVILAHNLDTKLGWAEGTEFTEAAADTSIEVSADLTDYVEGTDWELALNDDETAYVAVAKDGSTFFNNDGYMDSSVEIINFKTDTVKAYLMTYNGKGYSMRDLINETGTFANVAE